MRSGEIKIQDFGEFDEIFKHDLEAKDIPEDIKQVLKGPDAMTDGQHRMIIATCMNELEWTANVSFNFIVKQVPALRKRLSAKALTETDLNELYGKIKKNEASKIINILKSISRRQKGK